MPSCSKSTEHKAVYCIISYRGAFAFFYRFIRMCSQSDTMYRHGAMQASPLLPSPPPPLRGFLYRRWIVTLVVTFLGRLYAMIRLREARPPFVPGYDSTIASSLAFHRR